MLNLTLSHTRSSAPLQLEKCVCESVKKFEVHNNSFYMLIIPK